MGFCIHLFLPRLVMSDSSSPTGTRWIWNIFYDFINQFKINIFPVIQIQEERKFITIHTDPNHKESSQGAGGRTISDFTFIKVNNTDELISKALELYKN